MIHYFVSCSDDTIEVGADLYKIDTEAEASVTAAAPAKSSSAPSESTGSSVPPKEKQTPPPAPAPQVAASSSSTSHRTPSIKFLGKEGWAKLRTASQPPTLVYIPPNYGRPMISEAEMEALEMGGANMAPAVKMHSSGAMFG